MDVQNKSISLRTLERVKIAKSYIEKKYKMKKENELHRKQEWDNIVKKMDDLKLNDKEKNLVKNELLKKQSEFFRLTRKKISIREFESLSIIGRGAFGEVRVCREKATNSIVAIKKMRKEDMFQKNQILHVRTEREIMIMSNNPWVVNLKYSFQDETFLYLVMDYLPGGDLMSLLIKKDILKEEEARFYIAEIVLAIEALHKMGCIHRDIKPDNILIDKKGHIKLSDFGLSKLSDNKSFPLSTVLDDKMENQQLNQENIETYDISKPSSNQKYLPLEEEIKQRKKDRITAYSTVGTPDYIAPEVFGTSGYSFEVDWWSLGVIIFEMLVGFPPFFSENPSDTCQKIIKWRKHFKIPIDSNLSLEAENLIRKFICSPENRLGSYGVEAIKSHPFFNNFDWKNIHNTKAPFIPRISSDYDNKYFDKFEEKEPFYPIDKKQKKSKKDMNFLNYTYKKDLDKMKNSEFISAMEVLDALKLTQKENRCDPDKSLGKSENNISKDVEINKITDISNNNRKLSDMENSRNNIINKNVDDLKNKDLLKSQNNICQFNSSDSKLDTNSNSSSNQGKIGIKNDPLIIKHINGVSQKKHPIPTPKLNKDFIKEKIEISMRDKNQVTTNIKDYFPISAKNIGSKKVCFEANKYTHKIYNNVKLELKHKSPSPKLKDFNLVNSPNTNSNN